MIDCGNKRKHTHTHSKSFFRINLRWFIENGKRFLLFVFGFPIWMDNCWKQMNNELARSLLTNASDFVQHFIFTSRMTICWWSNMTNVHDSELLKFRHHAVTEIHSHPKISIFFLKTQIFLMVKKKRNAHFLFPSSIKNKLRFNFKRMVWEQIKKKSRWDCKSKVEIKSLKRIHLEK